uniref:Uncharacterized protein n=1 Tax=Trichobilharzia regenti TaxID=157069 RepID=A0AA85K9A4_TRIRE|nr:unnamed protein product [Trichobilharzia regenti]
MLPLKVNCTFSVHLSNNSFRYDICTPTLILDISISFHRKQIFSVSGTLVKIDSTSSDNIRLSFTFKSFMHSMNSKVSRREYLHKCCLTGSNISENHCIQVKLCI